MSTLFLLLKFLLFLFPGTWALAAGFRLRRRRQYLLAHGRETTGLVTGITTARGQHSTAYWATLVYQPEAADYLTTSLLVDKDCFVGARLRLYYDPRQPEALLLAEDVAPGRERLPLLLGGFMLLGGLLCTISLFAH
ncbi:hypothetical protein K3G63_01570 [Hymenobacter sp. HSC-4F20]|uniref:DUF3592 domain-containing protein n=1 Tax=Hymenobacter sp. HSC-4F20 TaxID=2864135 RepID=UPI001C7360F0|nr:DUF3592 domain-containing protein [Hymenobacter sp. HSC-4F20]MBX0289105.1 hypothetical protein [Hymenobacter sp. HSC-4F20]